jgi:hypothetical protein
MARMCVYTDAVCVGPKAVLARRQCWSEGGIGTKAVLA